MSDGAMCHYCRRYKCECEPSVSEPARKWEASLRVHWLAEIRCDVLHHEDTAVCACGLWYCPPQPTVGAAVETWIAHVRERATAIAEIESTAIGIPNVPAMVWAAEQKEAQARLAAGKCPVHDTLMRDTGKEEICDECEEQRNSY